MKNTDIYISRGIDQALASWKNEENRKPLLIRGPRQVGKSTAVRQLAQSFEYFIEVDFEAQRNLHALFSSSLNPADICEQLSLYCLVPIIEGKTLLFFDEIQSCLPAISSIRYFYEKMPNLHLIAAGSLLEFALQELPSFGVGRVRSLFIRPFSFNEFLIACDQSLMAQTLKKASVTSPIPDLIHKKIIAQYKRFMAIGGMPEVVAKFVVEGNMLACMKIIDDLIISYQDDFAKYKKLMPANRIKEAFEAVVLQMGGKFIYAKAALTSDPRQIKAAIELLILAGLVIPVTHTSSNGIPLGAEVDPKKRKMLIFDTGVFQRLLGLNIGELMISDSFEVVNKGALAELSVGLELSKLSSHYRNDPLYYWQRESVSGNAEIDYVFQKGEMIIPIEVKSGVRGSMQSLHLFLKEKKIDKGIRFSLENFSDYKNIRTIPLYDVPIINEF
ncbi:MAG: AAA family ATPase [Mariniphaga sp.]